MITQVLIFSKDRALQLQAAIESFYLHCTDADTALIRVLYKTSSARHERQYLRLRKVFPHVQFVSETDFRMQVMRLMADAPFIFFMVDDNIFFKPFSLAEILDAMESQPESIGFSLRLGCNTTYCHTRDINQALPSMESLNQRIVRAPWQNSEGNFGYPLELSSSVYRSSHMLALLYNVPFANPNFLESEMSIRADMFERFNWLLFFKYSVTFSNPVNRVQNTFANRIAEEVAIEAEDLADMYDQGQTINISAYTEAKPNSAHFEMPLIISSEKSEPILSDEFSRPLISVVIPTYNGEKFLSDAVKSMADQNYDLLEVIIVNDGSTDGSFAVGTALAEQYPELHIKVIDKENGGLAAARNDGIREASGQWILPLDCDDYFNSEFLTEALKVIATSPDVNLIFANMQCFGAKEDSWIPADFSVQTLMERNTFPYASLYRRELWEYSGGYDTSTPWGSQDWLFWIACTVFGLKVHRIAKPYFMYRTHAAGSMYTETMKHFDDVKLCLRSLQPATYSVATLLEDQEKLATMHPKTYERITARIEKKPHLAMPYFWNALELERAGRIADALAGYTKAAMLVPYAQWLPHFRLYLLNSHLGRKDASIKSAVATLRRRPELASLFRNCSGLDLQRMLPLNLALRSNLPQWQILQAKNYFEQNPKYMDEKKNLKDFGNDLEFIKKYYPLQKNLNVVVLGSGYGRETIMIAPQVKHVYGIDVSSRILDKCRRRLRSKGIDNFTGIRADLWKSKLSSNIDFVYSFEVFQHLTRDLVEDYLSGLYKKMAAGGKFLCQFAELADGTYDASMEVYEPNVKWTVPEIQDLVKRIGLNLYSVETLKVVGGQWHWAYFGVLEQKAEG